MAPSGPAPTGKGEPEIGVSTPELMLKAATEDRFESVRYKKLPDGLNAMRAGVGPAANGEPATAVKAH